MSKKPVFTKEDGTIKCHLLDHQLAAMNSKKRIAGIVGGRGCGKSIFLSAMIVKEMCQGGKVILFGQDYKALMFTLFKEVIDRFTECGFEPYVNYGTKFMSFNTGELYGYSYENIESVRGLSEVSLLILDELALAPKNIFETVIPCLRGAKRPTRILFATTPKKGSIWNKWFKDETVDKDIFSATMFDLPDDIITPEEKELQKNTIKDPAAFQQEMLGVILDDDVEFGVIKNSDYPLLKLPPHGIHRLGIDCAGSGGDDNVFVVVDDCSILDTVKINQADTYKMYNIANELIQRYDIRRVNIDTTGGFGNGIADMLQHNKANLMINRINFGQKPLKEQYLNARAEMYFDLAEKIRNGFYVSNNDVKEELQYVTYQINGSGKTLLRPKSEIKELIGRSPDTCDALALALYDIEIETITPEEGLDIAMKFVSI